MFRVAALAILLSTGPFIYPFSIVVQPQQVEETVSVDAAQALFNAGNTAAALATAEQIVAHNPFDVEAHHLIQRVYRRRGETASLVSRYRSFADRYPSAAAAQYLLGNVLLSVGNDRPAAQQYFDRALALDPRFGWAASINAILNQAAGNPTEALRLGQISAEEITNDISVAAIYADLLRLNGLRDEAIRFLRTAAAMNPQEPRYLTEMWSLSMRGAENVEATRAQFAAEVAANRARFLDTPENAALLAGFLSGPAMADRDASREVWLALADRFPDAPRAKNALLRAADYTADIDDKIALYSRMLDDYPDSPVRYTVYHRLIRELIDAEEFDRAKRTARDLTSELDPGRDGSDVVDRNEGPTPWGYTLQGIGYAGWFAAAQAEAGAKTVGRYNIRSSQWQRLEQPISPQALVAARALDASGCSDPKTLQYIGQILLNNTHQRALGIRLIQRAVQATNGAYPLTELAYGARELEEAREDLDRLLQTMPMYYADAGMLGEAERAVEELLRSLSADAAGFRKSEINYLAGYVFEKVGRHRDAARHFLVAQVYSTRVYEGLEESLTALYGRIADNEIDRYQPGAGPRVPLAASGIRPTADGLMSGEDLGGDLLLLLIWARWSEQSIAQIDMLDEMAESLAAQGVSVLGAVLQETGRSARPGGVTMFSAFLRDHPVEIPLGQARREAIERLELVGLPTTLLLDNTGRLVARQFSFGLQPGEWAMQWRDLIDEEIERRDAARR